MSEKSRHGRGPCFYTPEFARRVVHHMLQVSCGKHADEANHVKQQHLSSLPHNIHEWWCHLWDLRQPGNVHLRPCCLGMSVTSSSDDHGVANTVQSKRPLSKEERERVQRQLQLLHRASGHGSYESLVRSLEARKASSSVLELARQFKCATCEERKTPVPRRLANLEVNTERCKVVQFDAGWWAPPPEAKTNKCQFVIYVDEASRFAVGKVFRDDGGGHLTAKTFHELREPCFGVPQLLRSDPDGACRSKELDQHFQSLEIEVENIPADAHCKVSVVERVIQWVKELMSKTAVEHPEWGSEVLLAQAIRTWNQREPVRGFSPFQWMFGKAPDFEDRMFVPDIYKLPGSLLHHPAGGLARSEELRKISEKAFVDWQYQEKLSRVRNSRPRHYDLFMPGDLVYYWRRQGKNRQGQNAGLRRGS